MPCFLDTKSATEMAKTPDFSGVFTFCALSGDNSGSFELNDTNSKRLNFTDFSLHFYYSIKKHSLQYKNAESSLEFYNGNAKQTPAKLQPLSNNIFS